MLPMSIGLGTKPGFRAFRAAVVIGGLNTAPSLGLPRIRLVYTFLDEGVEAVRRRPPRGQRVATASRAAVAWLSAPAWTRGKCGRPKAGRTQDSVRRADMGGSVPIAQSMSQQVPLAGGDAAVAPPPLPKWMRFSAVRRLLVAVLAAFLTSVASEGRVPAEVQILVTWNTGVWIYILWTLALALRSDPEATRLHARSQAQSGHAFTLLLLSACLSSAVALGFLVESGGNLPLWSKAWHVALSVTALLGSWTLVHLLFAFHYASRYYQSALREDQVLHEGLAFAGEGAPEYFDFLYFSFAVGMSSTAPDVSTTTRAMRQTVMVHGVLAFVFNILILALSVNIVAAIV